MSKKPHNQNHKIERTAKTILPVDLIKLTDDELAERRRPLLKKALASIMRHKDGHFDVIANFRGFDRKQFSASEENEEALIGFILDGRKAIQDRTDVCRALEQAGHSIDGIEIAINALDDALFDKNEKLVWWLVSKLKSEMQTYRDDFEEVDKVLWPGSYKDETGGNGSEETNKAAA